MPQCRVDAMEPTRRLLYAIGIGAAIAALAVGLFVATGDLAFTAIGFKLAVFATLVFAFFPAIKRLATEQA